MMLRFHRFVERARLDGFFYYEFDRKNIVARMTMSSRASCERLRRYYHPWAGVYSTYEDFLKPFYRKKVGGATCYSQHKVNKISQVNEFKEWLVSQGLAPGHILTKKPAPKKPKTIEWRYNCGNCGHSYQRLSKPESLVVRCSLCGAFTSWTEKKSL
jgi:DNA-directed RNA polymerase subunit RPC12/RpoP